MACLISDVRFLGYNRHSLMDLCRLLAALRSFEITENERNDRPRPIRCG
jgi:hypothetical protein